MMMNDDDDDDDDDDDCRFGCILIETCRKTFFSDTEGNLQVKKPKEFEVGEGGAWGVFTRT